VADAKSGGAFGLKSAIHSLTHTVAVLGGGLRNYLKTPIMSLRASEASRDTSEATDEVNLADRDLQDR